MDGYTYIEILVEDDSGGILAKQIMDKYVADKDNIIYKIHSFKGIGKIPRKIKGMSQAKSKFKCECARNIGNFLDIENNSSQSFNHFIQKLDALVKS